ncbi:DUF2071 domain-containing protein [Leptospira sp. GIMC2001]|nr:DUF2071 domain-containing protein [Leptospira sp. GIMC2001]WCL51022.1 DUF2071 domain-containing protein [Leptospira sp. GIMC2001]
MKQELLNHLDHRPWDLPKRKWFWYQEWNNAIFLHYKVEDNLLRKFIPKNLDLDYFNNETWISVVAFTMNKIHIRNTFQIRPISNFHEVNLRTYVKMDEKQGVYFLSIEAEKIIPTILANMMSGLPYKHSNISRNPDSFRLTGKRSEINIKYNISGKKNPTKLDQWLTERYCLYKNHNENLNRLEIHHKPWELMSINITGLNIKYNEFRHWVDFNKPFCSHFSPGVKVIAWT